MYVYIRTESCWTVGFYDPDNEWNVDSNHETRQDAAERVSFLNGRNFELIERIERLEHRLDELENHEVSPYEAAMIVERANER